MQGGDEQAADRYAVANATAAVLPAAVPQHPPEQQCGRKEANVLETMHGSTLERPCVQRRGMPDPQRCAMKHGRADGMADEPPRQRQYPQIDNPARSRAE